MERARKCICIHKHIYTHFCIRVSFFFVFVRCAMWRAGHYFPNQGWDPCFPQWRWGLNHWTAATGPAYSSLYTSLYINGRDQAPHSSFLWPPSLVMRDLVPLSSIDLLTCSIFCKQPIAWSCWANCLAQPPPQTGLEHCQSILLAWAWLMAFWQNY